MTVSSIGVLYRTSKSYFSMIYMVIYEFLPTFHKKILEFASSVKRERDRCRHPLVILSLLSSPVKHSGKTS